MVDSSSNHENLEGTNNEQIENERKNLPIVLDPNQNFLDISNLTLDILEQLPRDSAKLRAYRE